MSQASLNAAAGFGATPGRTSLNARVVQEVRLRRLRRIDARALNGQQLT